MNATVTEQFRVEEDALGNVEVPAEQLRVHRPSGLISTFQSVSSVSAGDGRSFALSAS
jgi:hypothetical protein